MGNLFHPESPLMRILGDMADLILLNLIWLACCVPVATAGPATAALCCVARSMAAGDRPPVLRAFFRAFRENFRQGLLVFVILLVPAAMAVLYLLLTASGGLDENPLMRYLCYIAMVLIGFVCSYAYPLMAHFDNTVGNTLKNAVLLPLANPLLAVIVTALNLLPVLLLVWSPALFFRVCLFWILIGCALTAFINARLLGGFFARLAPPETGAEEAK